MKHYNIEKKDGQYRIVDHDTGKIVVQFDQEPKIYLDDDHEYVVISAQDIRVTISCYYWKDRSEVSGYDWKDKLVELLRADIERRVCGKCGDTGIIVNTTYTDDDYYRKVSEYKSTCACSK